LANPDTIGITSGVTGSGKPFVALEWGEKRAQLTPNEARAHALAILECAEAAEADSAFMAFCEKNGITGEGMAMAMRDFRILRWRGEQSDPTLVRGLTGPLCQLCGQVIFPGTEVREGAHGPVHRLCLTARQFVEEQGDVKH